MMADIVKLPTAPASYYTIRRSGRFFWNVVLVTPCEPKPIITKLRRWTDREAAFADAAATANLAKRPFKGRAA